MIENVASINRTKGIYITILIEAQVTNIKMFNILSALGYKGDYSNKSSVFFDKYPKWKILCELKLISKCFLGLNYFVNKANEAFYSLN